MIQLDRAEKETRKHLYKYKRLPNSRWRKLIDAVDSDFAQHVPANQYILHEVFLCGLPRKRRMSYEEIAWEVHASPASVYRAVKEIVYEVMLRAAMEGLLKKIE